MLSIKTRLGLFVVMTGALLACGVAAASETTYSRGPRSGIVPDSGRPGEFFFTKGVVAIGLRDYKYAVNMYRTSANWAYKPAQYNLGVMYFKGEGVPVDHALGLAWLALAAERGDPDYVAARDFAYSTMSDEDYDRANALWRDLRQQYGDAVALKRAKQRWKEVKTSETGSHLGADTGELSIKRSLDGSGGNPGGTGAPGNTASQSAVGIFGPGIDGSIAYRQLHESDNPYDAKFRGPDEQVKVLDIIPIGESVKRKAPTGPDQPRFY